MDDPKSLTGKYLTGELKCRCPSAARPNQGRTLKVVGARGNNLKNVTAEIPLGTVHLHHRRLRRRQVDAGDRHALQGGLARKLNGARAPAPHDRIEGIEHIDKVIDIDQSPIGRTPRSNPATYTGAFTPIREWFAGLPEAKARGYQPGASRSTSRAAAARPARATASSRSRCTSCPTSTSPATSARASATTARRWK
jgi:excinuclease ABC subunit A